MCATVAACVVVGALPSQRVDGICFTCIRVLSDRVSLWANFARESCPVSCNMFVESFNNMMKRRFMNGKANRRLDCLIGVLLEEVIPYYCGGYSVLSVNPTVKECYRKGELHGKHREAMTMNPASVVTVGRGLLIHGVVHSFILKHILETNENGLEIHCQWNVPSSSDPEMMYTVSKDNFNCRCNVTCNYCKVCPEFYKCNCYDYVKYQKANACKHIHLVHMATCIGKLHRFVVRTCCIT